jgi:hypothetical protein
MTHGTAGWLAWLEGLPVSVAMRHWLWLYPGVEIVHIAGFVVLVGTAVVFDLRLLGVSPRLPVADLARHLTVWATVGLALIVPTGLLMFSAHAGEMAENPAFRLKLILIAAAGINALAFRVGAFRTVAAWGCGSAAPPGARASAVLSLVLWAGIIACGRLLAYL